MVLTPEEGPGLVLEPRTPGAAEGRRNLRRVTSPWPRGLPGPTTGLAGTACNISVADPTCGAPGLERVPQRVAVPRFGRWSARDPTGFASRLSRPAPDLPPEPTPPGPVTDGPMWYNVGSLDKNRPALVRASVGRAVGYVVRIDAEKASDHAVPEPSCRGTERLRPGKAKGGAFPFGRQQRIKTMTAIASGRHQGALPRTEGASTGPGPETGQGGASTGSPDHLVSRVDNRRPYHLWGG